MSSCNPEESDTLINTIVADIDTLFFDVCLSFKKVAVKASVALIERWNHKDEIEGLSRSGEHYDESVQCLQEQYDCPRLIHQARVRKIFEVPSLKDNSGEELRYLHNVLQEHLHARKS